MTNIIGNEVFFSGDYKVDADGNNLSVNFFEPTPNNFGSGSGARFDVERVSGSYSVTLTDTTQFNNLPPDSYSGTFGNGATFTVTVDHTNGTYSSVNLTGNGSAYSATETVTILGTNLGGAYPANDLVITIDTVDATGSILTFTPDAAAVASTVNTNVGQNYVAGETLVIFGTTLDGDSPANDLYINILTTSPTGGIGTFNFTGDGVSPNQTYPNLSGTTNGSGINGSFNVERLGGGLVLSQIEEIQVGGVIESR